MKSLLFTAGILFLFHSLNAQNVGVGETAPTAKLEVKSDGNSNAINSFLVKNSDNNRLFHLNGSGSATFGSVNFTNPGHLVGIHNGLQPARAHLGLYATGALLSDAGAINRIGFSNLTNGFRQFEIQSYTGTSIPLHSLSFKYFDFSTSPTTETTILTLNADGSAQFNGAIRASNFNVTSSGNQHDFLTRGANAGDVSTKKGTGALGMNYIICVNGSFPTFSAGSATDQPMLAEVRLWAGVIPPTGWKFCNGEVLLIGSNTALFSLIGTLYGGNGATTFALPDLRGAAPVQQGTPPTGRAWGQGERSF
jgi:microcystin-dependent protein